MSKVHSCCDDGVIKLDAHWSEREERRWKREEGRGKQIDFDILVVYLSKRYLHRSMDKCVCGGP